MYSVIGLQSYHVLSLLLDEVINMNNIEIHQAICESLTDLYRRKNTDYGDSFHKAFEEFGMVMPCIRLEDKLNRIKQLAKSVNREVNDEGITDTLMDLANYAIMTLIEIESISVEGIEECDL